MSIDHERSADVAFGWRVYGFGVMAVGMVCLAWGNFDLGQPVPKDFPHRTALACAAAVFMIAAGAAVEWRRTAAWGAAALTGYYALIVVVLMNGRIVLAHYAEFGAYSGAAEQLAIAAGGLIVFAANAKIDAESAARLTRLGQLAFGICALLFGGAHFFYMNFTAPMVPKWLPPTPEFWAYATGIGHIAAGVAILTGVQARQLCELDRKRLESRLGRRCLGGRGLSGACELPACIVLRRLQSSHRPGVSHASSRIRQRWIARHRRTVLFSRSHPDRVFDPRLWLDGCLRTHPVFDASGKPRAPG